MAEESVSVQDLRDHYGIYRWVIERPSATGFVRLWGDIGQSGLGAEEKVILANVIWALASLQRASATLEENAVRTEGIRKNGPTAAMALLSGPYGVQSLDYLLAQSLWQDLADTLIWYRAIRDRLRFLVGSARRQRIPLTVDEVREELEELDGRRLPELGNEKATDLADKLLHRSWHPATASLSIDWYWIPTPDGSKLNFTGDGDLRASLLSLVEEASTQVEELVGRLC